MRFACAGERRYSKAMVPLTGSWSQPPRMIKVLADIRTATAIIMVTSSQSDRFVLSPLLPHRKGIQHTTLEWPRPSERTDMGFLRFRDLVHSGRSQRRSSCSRELGETTAETGDGFPAERLQSSTKRCVSASSSTSFAFKTSMAHPTIASARNYALF